MLKAPGQSNGHHPAAGANGGRRPGAGGWPAEREDGLGDRPAAPRRVLITGGSSGIGAATARAFAARSYRLAVAGRDQEALNRVAKDTGGVSIPGDLRDKGCPQRTVETAVTALGGLDVVVSNAGVGWSGPFTSMTVEEIDSLLDVNLRAAAHVTLASLRYLQPGRGHLVFVGSIAGVVGVPGEAWYSATKAGLTALASLLRAELKDKAIGVTLVTPGVVDTAYFERRNSPYLRNYPRPISADVVASAIVDAVERYRENIILPGWLSWPARLKVSFPGLYRLLESRFA
jgi:short-subunit dehydrogenase